MNETIKALHSRKSVRAFTDQPVTPAVKEQLFNACFQAPTAGNQMLYTIIDVTDQAIKEQLVKSCDNQPFIASAPIVWLFLADCRRWYDCYLTAGANPRKPGVGDLLLACEDALIAAQNAVVAAESLGLGSCYIGDILENAETHQAMFNLDDYVVPIAMLVMGYPTQSQKTRQKPGRFKRDYIVFENSYRRLNGDEQQAMFKDLYGEDYDFNNKIKAFCNRKYNSDFSVEMSRSSEYYLKPFLVGDYRAEK